MIIRRKDGGEYSSMQNTSRWVQSLPLELHTTVRMGRTLVELSYVKITASSSPSVLTLVGVDVDIGKYIVASVGPVTLLVLNLDQVFWFFVAVRALTRS
jgi:hypothetical protein